MTTFMTYKEECESLRRELENERARDIHSCGPDCARSGCVNRRLREELAASQASEQQLREALNQGYGWAPIGSTSKQIMGRALALPQDTAALSAMIAKACEVMREVIAADVETQRNDIPATGIEFAAAIRAIPAVTLDDLQGGA